MGRVEEKLADFLTATSPTLEAHGEKSWDKDFKPCAHNSVS